MTVTVDLEIRRVSDNVVFWNPTGLSALSNSNWSGKVYSGTALVDGTQYKIRSRLTGTVHEPLGPGDVTTPIDTTTLTPTFAGTGGGFVTGGGGRGTPSDIEANGTLPPGTTDWSSYYYWTPDLSTTPVATQVAPTSGAQVGTLTPDITLAYSNSKPAQTYSSYQLEVRRVSDGTYFWQPGEVAATADEIAANQTTVVYAGTALVAATAYEWRVRVKSSRGIWSNYTGWYTFTPVIAPNPPSGIAPSGLQNTLTPAISGTYNQGAGGTESKYQYIIQQYPSGVAVYDSGEVTGVIGTGQNYGTNNPSDTPSSPPALAWGTAYQIKVRSKDNAGAWSDYCSWVLFNTNAAPTAPSSVQPNGAITSDTTPTLSWVHNDADGDAQTAVDIELYDQTAAAYVTGYNPKTLAQATLTHDVSGTTLTLTHVYQLRVRTKGLAGPGYGPWSNPVTFTVATGPTIAFTAPATDEVLTQSAFLPEWTLTGGSGTQQDYQVKIYENDQSTVVYDSGVQPSVILAGYVPAGYLVNAADYYIQVFVHDTLNQLGQTEKRHISTAWTPPATPTGQYAAPVGSQ